MKKERNLQRDSINFGKEKISRLFRQLFFPTLIGMISLVSGLAHLICLMFLSPEVEAFKLVVEGLPKFAICGIFFAINIAFIGYYQSLEKAYRAAIFTMLRGIIFIVPMFLCLPHILGISGLWYAIPAAELLTMIVIVADFTIAHRHNY